MNWTAFFVCWAAAFPVSSAMAAADPAAAARLGSTTCAAQLRESNSSRPLTLSASRDQARPLAAGQQVRCSSPSGYLTVQLATGPRRISAEDGWFSIPTREAQAAQADFRQTMAEALEHHSTRPAASRGGDESASLEASIYPKPYGFVLPDQFTILWKPLAAGGKIEFRITAPGLTDAIWSGETDGAAGGFESPAARTALRQYRAEHHKRLVELEWKAAEESGSVPFNILPTPEEQALKTELAFWDQNPDDISRFLGRAYSFDVRKLYWEAAQNYEAALKAAPGSCTLLHEARNAESTVGNVLRVTEIDESLAGVAGGCDASRPQAASQR